MKLKNKKGFTMAELLIVIAIIAVLIAVAFPVFGAQLAKAQYSVDVANVRSAYSEEVADAMMSSDYDATTGKLNLDATAWDNIKKAAVNTAPDKITFDTTEGAHAIKIEPPTGVTAQDIPVDADVTIETN